MEDKEGPFRLSRENFLPSYHGNLKIDQSSVRLLVDIYLAPEKHFCVRARARKEMENRNMIIYRAFFSPFLNWFYFEVDTLGRYFLFLIQFNCVVWFMIVILFSENFLPCLRKASLGKE